MRNYQIAMEAPKVFTRRAVRSSQKFQSLGKSCSVIAAAVLSALLLSACATQEMERPIAQMTRAETAIQNAVDAGARQAAPVQLQTAQQHFSRAEQASVDEEYLQAERLAEKAEADAQLAETIARNAEAQETIAQLEEGLRTLQEETRRGDF